MEENLQNKQIADIAAWYANNFSSADYKNTFDELSENWNEIEYLEDRSFEIENKLKEFKTWDKETVSHYYNFGNLTPEEKLSWKTRIGSVKAIKDTYEKTLEVHNLAKDMRENIPLNPNDAFNQAYTKDISENSLNDFDETFKALSDIKRQIENLSEQEELQLKKQNINQI